MRKPSGGKEKERNKEIRGRKRRPEGKEQKVIIFLLQEFSSSSLKTDLRFDHLRGKFTRITFNYSEFY